MEERLRMMEDAVNSCRKAGLSYRILNNNLQLNIIDASGQPHSYYPTTKKMVFNCATDQSKKISFSPVELTDSYLQIFKDPDKIQEMFKEKRWK